MQPSKWKALSLNKAKQKEQIKLKPTKSKVLQFTQTQMDVYDYNITFHTFLFITKIKKDLAVDIVTKNYQKIFQGKNKKTYVAFLFVFVLALTWKWSKQIECQKYLNKICVI